MPDVSKRSSTSRLIRSERTKRRFAVHGSQFAVVLVSVVLLTSPSRLRRLEATSGRTSASSVEALSSIGTPMGDGNPFR